MIRIKSRSGKFIALLSDDLSGGFSVMVTSWGVEAFSSTWPCSHLGSQPIVFDFAVNGDLIGVSTSRDGEDVAALSEDAQSFGEACLERRRKQKIPNYPQRP